jgi:hypothetical protein
MAGKSVQERNKILRATSTEREERERQDFNTEGTEARGAEVTEKTGGRRRIATRKMKPA